MKRFLRVVVCCLAALLAAGFSSAADRTVEVTLLYTGDTHAMLYPCNCPIEPDGGVSRRAGLVEQVRASVKHTLLVDSGAFFAGGLMDEYTQNSELDAERTRINLRSMEAMGYDAVALGDEEFFFGTDFLKSAAASWRVPLLCANVSADFIKPFVVKEVAGLRFGIVAAVTETARQKAVGLTVGEPLAALSAAVAKLRRDGVDVVVVLSHLGESVDMKLLEQVQGIDILVSGNGRAATEAFTTVGQTLLLRPSWQGRRLGRADLTFREKKLAHFKVEELRLSDAVAPGRSVAGMVPACFSDRNCIQNDRSGTCSQPGTRQSSCVFPVPVKAGLTVISDSACRTCNTDAAIASFRKSFPALEVSYADPQSSQARTLLDLFGSATLPQYLFSSEIEQSAEFSRVAERFEHKDNWYRLKEEYGGIGMFLNRQPVKGSLDFFVDVFDPNLAALLAVLEEFRPQVHFIPVSQEVAVQEAGAATEEMLRCVCVKKYYPGLFWNYLTARSRNMRSAWWEDALGAVDPAPVRACARSAEGRQLLEANTALAGELGITAGPAYVMDNREIFSSKQVPRKEELRTMITGKRK